ANRLPDTDADAVIKKGSDHYIDLRKWAEIRLVSSGLSRKNIFVVDMCTSCCKHLFYSYRADKAHRGSNAAVVCKI
ncbi:MAG: laccase domain-containing protein, partial [bacterium]